MSREQAWIIEDGANLNVTPTDPGYCEFFDGFGCHAYMGGAWDGERYRDDWTTCCAVDEPASSTPGGTA